MRGLYRPKILWRSLAVIVGLLALSTASYFVYMDEQGNFHAVTEGQVYRSGQLDEDTLTHYIQKCGIKSILNLRGKNPDHGWYQVETRVAREMGVVHYDYAISAIHPLPNEKIGEILNILLAAPKPVLLHCKGGADRSGLISAVWQYAVEGKSAEEAADQLSARFGHVPFLEPDTRAMDDTFWRFVEEYQPPSERRPSEVP